jgi:hypothetical protein
LDRTGSMALKKQHKKKPERKALDPFSHNWFRMYRFHFFSI